MRSEGFQMLRITLSCPVSSSELTYWSGSVPTPIPSKVMRLQAASDVEEKMRTGSGPSERKRARISE